MKKTKKQQPTKKTKNTGLQGYPPATQERLLRDLASRILFLQPCISNLTPHTPAFTPLTTHFTPRASQLQTSHLRPQISHLTHHNSRLTPPTSHLTRHTLWLHFRLHTSQARAGTLFLYMVAWLWCSLILVSCRDVCLYGQTQNMNSPVSHVLSIIAA